jgi:hypothetical protein
MMMMMMMRRSRGRAHPSSPASMRKAMEAWVAHAGAMEQAYAAPGDDRRTKSHTACDDAMYPPTDPNDCVEGVGV